ncbi:MFS family permease [Agromyces terreus]|uniref:MFS family permease n=1 Tax=Agromyces terreus TaxID=424795 RepID=A0A9X2KC49_9MICO|nr:MFS transporter [Agromyces terreus]MCP2370855.1 MFS family permease [Agromyces terreus]
MSDRAYVDPAHPPTLLGADPGEPGPGEPAAPPGAHPPARARRALAAASIGTALEWYDFFLYGTAAALVFPALFFPGEDPLTGVLLSFAVYATGFLARPLGGLAAGYLGDRFSRRTTLLATLLLMGIATALIGLLPTYAQIGALAPALLVGLRLLQGAATGGEWGGAVLLALESSPEHRGRRGGLIQSALYLGLILGNLAFVLLVAALDEEQLLAWGWRVPFLASLVLVGVGVYLRRRVDDSSEFTALLEQRRTSRHPLADALRQPRNVLAVFLVRAGQNTTFYLVSVFCLSYAASLGFERWVTLTALLVGAGIAVVACPIWGRVGERVGPVRLTVASLGGLAVIAVPLFLALDTGSAALVIGVVALAIGVVNAAADGVQPMWFTSLFDARVRYSGITIGREAGAIVGGGLTPLLAAWLVATTGHWWPVAALMVAGAVLGIVGALIARRSREPVA